MNAGDFRDYMLLFLFLRYLSDNYEQAARKELGADYLDPNGSCLTFENIVLVTPSPHRRVSPSPARVGALGSGGGGL